MREFKFRAWVTYKTDHRWEFAWKKREDFCKTNQDFDDDDGQKELLERFLNEWDAEHKQEERYSSKEYMTHLDEVSISLSGKLVRLINLEVLDIMQFTGLKDKNGKEIYEGDLLKLDNLLMTIEWIPEWSRFMGVVDEIRCPLEEASLLKCEIIGNIYENPELLKESGV